MGDFTGFTFGGIHSSDLGITRVSSSNRYNEKLQPEIKDRTAEVPGLDGMYYFGSEYGTQSFDLDLAFDSLTELQIKQLKRCFDGKQVKELIFDEYPFKKYMVKITNPIELSYVCFDEPIKTIVGINMGDERYGVRKVEEVVSEVVIDEETGEETTVETVVRIPERIYPYEKQSKVQRIYKGEMKVSLTAFFPFAKSVYKQLPVEEEESDWVVSSGILSQDLYQMFDKYDKTTGKINIYNAGEIKTGFRLYCPFEATKSIRLTYNPYYGADTSILNITTMIPKTNITGAKDVGFLINTENELVQGIQSFGYDQNGNAIYTTSGNIYNQYIASGYFFKLEPNMLYTDEALLEITDEDYHFIDSNDIEIFYDYLYF